MSTLVKQIENLKVEELEKFPVWQYTNHDARGETLVKPVKKYPVKSLTAKIVGLKVVISNGDELWAIIGNVDVNNSSLTEHFITISFYFNRKWSTLARYHDFDYEKNGPEALAAFLQRDVDAIFPISYDISPYAVGDRKALAGKIEKEPLKKLTRSEIIALAVP